MKEDKKYSFIFAKKTMIRRITLLLNCLILFLLLFSCGEDKPSAFKDIKGGFQINFNGKPIESSDDQLFPFGRVEWTIFTSEAGDDQNLSYTVSYTDLPKQIIHSDSLRLLAQLFSLTQLTNLSKFGEKGLDNTFFKTANMYPGRQFTWDDRTNKISYTQQFFLVKNRLYKLEVSYKSSEKHNKMCVAFFKSFKLLTNEQNKHPELIPEKARKNFTIQYPGNVKRQEQQGFGFFGPQTIMIEGYENKDTKPDQYHNIAYMTLYGSLPKDSINKLSVQARKDLIVLIFRTNSLIAADNNILSERESTFNGQWCYEGSAGILAGKATVTYRMFLKDNVMYQLSVMSENGYENNPRTRQFFDSFRFNE
ncbi:MAG: hypothetical protein QE487_07035 [Fluviicola sp.]|nr:hypothetical protein [Fluviicola sp.]